MCTCRCIGSKEPREFSAGPLGILNNLSELMVHEIEAACERANQRQQVWGCLDAILFIGCTGL